MIHEDEINQISHYNEPITVQPLNNILNMNICNIGTVTANIPILFNEKNLKLSPFLQMDIANSYFSIHKINFVSKE
jgi:hypothetical protein